MSPRRISDQAFSQIDIAPTLVDLIGLSVDRHHFQGVSLFSDVSDNSVFLVQPYDGIFLSVVDLPFKYGKQLSSGNEFLYNVILDPFEKTNLIDRYNFQADKMERQLDIIYKTN